ncbi:MAG: sodium:proton antiporter [Acidobacteriota bacterium]|nr:MAG: sodium:proton antiporter [Acidobacteriota bacterium]
MSHAVSIPDIRRSARQVSIGLIAVIVLYLVALAVGVIPAAHHEIPGEAAAVSHEAPVEHFVPSVWAVLPFVALLLCIAVLPLISVTAHWWESNRNRFVVAATLALVTLVYYAKAHPGGLENHLTHQGGSAAGLDTVRAAFSNAFFSEYIPFIVLLFSLYVISGGINLRGDLPAHPFINCVFIGSGALLASFIGTTGAAMVLIRPLLATNAERKNKTHTVLFFIFAVCNCGGLLLPIGDPPLFLGYLRGVPFTWTLQLWPYWLAVNLALLIIYYIWDRIAYSREPVKAIIRDESKVEPLRFSGLINFPLILGVVFCVAFVIPGEHLFGTDYVTPNFFRDMLMIVLVILSLQLTNAKFRLWNKFDYHAIVEVAALFFGIFITMQVPIEILNVKGSSLGISSPISFFWATGILSSFLDNAPTYVVFFETAAALPAQAGASVVQVIGGRSIMEAFLIPISLGAVFMGANTYIGNGPNFMVKSIAEQAGVKMPSFFGYMIYSCLILGPIWIAMTFLLA